MAFKLQKNNISFADGALLTSIEKSKAIKRMEQINTTIRWDGIENIIVESDPELETQINDRISFKKFLGIALDEPAPDHSPFSRIRERLSEDTLEAINSEILKQFTDRGFTISEGVVVDARLVQSASRPLSNEALEAAPRCSP